MKDRVQQLFDKPINVKDKYKTTGITQRIVRSPWFENTCMAVIFLNAIWIGIEMSFNPAEVLAYADPPFIIVENLFCVFFFAEIVLRLHAFSRMCNAFRDKWFVLFGYPSSIPLCSQSPFANCASAKQPISGSGLGFSRFSLQASGFG